MYITNRPEVAGIAEKNGVDRIFVDMEYIGKKERQKTLNSVQNRHSMEDLRNIRKTIRKSQVLVRVNPIHEQQADGYPCSEEEIDSVIRAGADIVMLPYYKTLGEVTRFLEAVDRRARTILLLETKEAAELVDEICSISGVDEVHIGLNDLAISYQSAFLFEMLVNGTVERLCRHLRQNRMTYGFGGLASLGRGLVPAEIIIKEHYRLGSTGAILSRSFCNINNFEDLHAIEEVFYRGIREIRNLERECEEYTRFFTENEKALKEAVDRVLKERQK